MIKAFGLFALATAALMAFAAPAAEPFMAEPFAAEPFVAAPLAAELFAARPDAVSGDTPAPIAETPGRYLSYGLGTMRCQNWLYVRSHTDADSVITAWAAGQWLGGYITAFNFYIDPENNALGDQDIEQAQEWIDRYCAVFPQEQLSNAAAVLIADRQNWDVPGVGADPGL